MAHKSGVTLFETNVNPQQLTRIIRTIQYTMVAVADIKKTFMSVLYSEMKLKKRSR